MKCPHCLVEFHAKETLHFIGEDSEGRWGIVQFSCPNPSCRKDVLYLVLGGWVSTNYGYNLSPKQREILIRPKTANRPPVPVEVPKEFAEDYTEACLVLADSAKASAALSRRALQYLLREKAGVDPGNLADEIQQVIDSGQLPSYLVESIDAVRNIGNFAAHPIKSQSTGEIVPVEPGEAEWNLDVLESLFDFYFVQPAVVKAKRDALNKKLGDAGKPSMK